MASSAYGDLIRLHTGNGDPPETLTRVPFGVRSGEGGIDEATLRDLLFDQPQALPIAAIDGDYGDPIPVCTELATPAGYVDAVYVNARGRLVLAEFKLWRNPEARREVIGQIIDYAKDLASWGYEDLQRQVSRALGRTGNALYQLVRERHPETEEAHFVDEVTRRLARGEFLLLIVGDGIREGVRGIVDFVQAHSGLRFNLALVEAALYRDGPQRLIVQPRVIARTEILQRTVFERGEAAGPEPERQASPSDEENLRFWKAVTAGYSFSDVSVEPPQPTSEAPLYVKVKNSGYGDYGLCFEGSIYRRQNQLRCFLTRRKDIDVARRVFDELVADIDELRLEIDGLAYWEDPSGLVRLGLTRAGGLEFLAGNEDDDAYKDAVAWMREHLDRLVSTLNPRIQRLIAAP